MAWVQADLDTIDAALRNNVRKVTFADGRSTEWHDPSELLAVRKIAKAELLASSTRAGARATRATMRRA